MSQVGYPTLEDIKGVERYLDVVKGFVRITLGDNNETFQEMGAREDRFCRAAALLKRSCLNFEEIGLTTEDCLWVEKHARDCRPGIFPPGCGARFAFARTTFMGVRRTTLMSLE